MNLCTNPLFPRHDPFRSFSLSKNGGTYLGKTFSNYEVILKLRDSFTSKSKVTCGKGKYQCMDNTKIGKERENSYQKMKIFLLCVNIYLLSSDLERHL